MKKLLAVAFLFISVISFAQLSITHNMPSSINPGASQDIEFTINKGSVGGFAKFQCDLPFGFTATNVDSKSGNFTFENQRLKIVWVSVPGDASFTFKFTMGVPANAINSASISAKFFYLENNVKKELDMPAHTMKFGEGSVTSTPTNTVAATPTNTVTSTPTNTVAATPTNTVTSTPTNTVATTPTNTVAAVPTNTVAATPTNTVTSTPTNTVTSTPTKTTTTTPSSTGVTYKVQLGAFSSSPAKSKFPGVNFTVTEEGGYFKAVSGNFNNIDDALKHKSELSAKGYQGFIVAYKNGQRIGLK
ncbi:MAG: hypothetical protein IPG89_07005 [Bacteroidetes bacterium]|nr:hypothetical protein [Bacteroidota bacterium]